MVFYHKALPKDDLFGIFDVLDNVLGMDTPKPTYLPYAGYARCPGCGNRIGGAVTMTLFCDNPCEDCKLTGTDRCCKVTEGVGVCGEQNHNIKQL